MAGRRNQSSAGLLLLLIAAAVQLVLFASTATAQQQNCSSATFSSGRPFQRCTSLPTLGASLHWTYHPANGTADVAFRAPSGTAGWVAWGINPDSAGMVGSSVFVASQSQDGSGAVSVLMTYLQSTSSPSLTNGTLKLDVPAGPAAEYDATGGAYTIYATVALPGNSTVQNTVWQAGPLLSGGGIAVHPMAPANLGSTQKLDFLGTKATGKLSRGLLSRRNLRGFLG